jgi:hypothetical protein
MQSANEENYDYEPDSDDFSFDYEEHFEFDSEEDDEEEGEIPEILVVLTSYGFSYAVFNNTTTCLELGSRGRTRTTTPLASSIRPL